MLKGTQHGLSEDNAFMVAIILIAILIAIISPQALGLQKSFSTSDIISGTGQEGELQLDQKVFGRRKEPLEQV